MGEKCDIFTAVSLSSLSFINPQTSPLMLELVKFHVEEKRVDVHQLSPSGTTLIYEAAKLGDLDLVKYFADKGVDLHRENKDGKTPVDVALNNGYLNVAEFLVANDIKLTEEKKNDINKQIKTKRASLKAFDNSMYCCKFFVLAVLIAVFINKVISMIN